jgi:hypothetical protein
LQIQYRIEKKKLETDLWILHAPEVDIMMLLLEERFMLLHLSFVQGVFECSAVYQFALSKFACVSIKLTIIINIITHSSINPGCQLPFFWNISQVFHIKFDGT